MKSLMEYIQNYLKESLLDISNTNDEDLKLYIAKWLSEHNSFRITIDPSCINIKNGKADVKYNGKNLLIVNIGNGHPEQIPFKLGKFDGFISANWIKDFDGTNLPDECYGLEFNHISKLKWKNAHVKINTYPIKDKHGNSVDFYNSPGALKSMRNITFEFTGENRRLYINKLKSKMLDNITLINCEEIYVNDALSMSEAEIQKIKGVERINYLGDVIDIK